jgi:hypothetical protein
LKPQMNEKKSKVEWTGFTGLRRINKIKSCQSLKILLIL